MDDPQPEDMSMLRNFEPVVRFTAGELFFPTAVEPYVAQSALWEIDGDGSMTCLVASGSLSIERLVAEAGDRPHAALSLRFVATPLRRKELRWWRKRPDRPRFGSRGRFTLTPATASAASALRPDRATSAAARYANHGPTRSGGLGCRRSRPRPASQPNSCETASTRSMSHWTPRRRHRQSTRRPAASRCRSGVDRRPRWPLAAGR